MDGWAPLYQDDTMNISGEEAKNYHAVRLDDFRDAHAGELVSADDQTGVVVYRDTPETTKTLTLGERAIRILRKR